MICLYFEYFIFILQSLCIIRTFIIAERPNYVGHTCIRYAGAGHWRSASYPKFICWNSNPEAEDCWTSWTLQGQTIELPVNICYPSRHRKKDSKVAQRSSGLSFPPQGHGGRGGGLPAPWFQRARPTPGSVGPGDRSAGDSTPTGKAVEADYCSSGSGRQSVKPKRIILELWEIP